MKYLILIFAFVVNVSFAQRSGSYRGNLVEEKVFSKSKNCYVTIDETYMTTKIVYTKDRIVFKKGQSDWLQNTLVYDETFKASNGIVYDRYHDDKNQSILMDYLNKEILYYYNYDSHTETFLNVAIYKNLYVDESLVDEVAERFFKIIKFRVDYDVIAIYDAENDSWSDWKKGNNSFIVNVNANGDIMHIKHNGEKVTYRMIADAERGVTDKGETYQMIKALDKAGRTFTFQIFDEPTLGCKFIYQNVIIQFAKL